MTDGQSKTRDLGELLSGRISPLSGAGGAKGSFRRRSECCLSAASPSRAWNHVWGGEESDYGGWLTNQSVWSGTSWPFKVPLCLSAQLVTKSLSDRLPVSPTVVLVQHCFSCLYKGWRVGGLHHTTSPEGRQLRTRGASSTHRQQTARQEKTGTSHTKAKHLTAGLFCSAS